MISLAFTPKQHSNMASSKSYMKKLLVFTCGLLLTAGYVCWDTTTYNKELQRIQSTTIKG